jgi:paraquat-inducible protein B
VAFDFFPGAAPTTVDWSQTPVQLPTIPGQLEATEASVENIIKKIGTMPLKQIGDNLQRTLADLDLTLVSARGTLVSARSTIDNANTLVEPNSLQSQELDSTLQEVRRAARSVRVLADYLERHPEALIRGKKGEAK